MKLFIIKAFIYLLFFSTTAQSTKPNEEYNVGYSLINIINTNICPNNFLSANTKKNFSIKNTQYCNEIQLAIYYPTLKSCSSPYPAIKTVTQDLIEINPHLKNNGLLKVANIKTEICTDSPVIEKQFPVILFSPGYGLPSQLYTNTLSNLVKNGFIVIGINSQFINGKLQFAKSISNVIEPRNEKAKQTLFINSFEDLNFVYQLILSNTLPGIISHHINKNEIGVLGHSLGSRSAAKLGNNKNICGIAAEDLTIDLIDGNNCHQKLKKPFLHLFSTELYGNNRTLNRPYLCKSNENKCYKKVFIIGNPRDIKFSKHLNFCDYSSLQENPIIKPLMKNINDKPEFFLGSGDGQLITNQINTIILKFFQENCSTKLRSYPSQTLPFYSFQYPIKSRDHS